MNEFFKELFGKWIKINNAGLQTRSLWWDQKRKCLPDLQWQEDEFVVRVIGASSRNLWIGTAMLVVSIFILRGVEASNGVRSAMLLIGIILLASYVLCRLSKKVILTNTRLIVTGLAWDFSGPWVGGHHGYLDDLAEIAISGSEITVRAKKSEQGTDWSRFGVEPSSEKGFSGLGGLLEDFSALARSAPNQTFPLVRKKSMWARATGWTGSELWPWIIWGIVLLTDNPLRDILRQAFSNVWMRALGGH